MPLNQSRLRARKSVESNITEKGGIFPDTFECRPDMGIVANNAIATHFEPLRDRSEEWAKRVSLVERASKFIYISSYYILWDKYGREMLGALKDALLRGVHVIFILDKFGQWLSGLAMGPTEKNLLNQAIEEINNLGGEISFYSPPAKFPRYFGGGQHIKIQITDEGYAIFGSSNFAAHSYEHWDEFSVLVAGPVCLALLDSFKCLEISVRPRDRESIAKLDFHQGSRPIVLDYGAFNPNRTDGTFARIFKRIINSQTLGIQIAMREAKKSILLTTFYYKPSSILRKEILAARARGVQVSIFHSDIDALGSMRLAWLAAASEYKQLLSAGVEIYESRSGEHSKVTLIDDCLALFGSYNFEHAANDRLAEATMASKDTRVVNSIRKVIDDCKSKSEQVTLDKFEQLPAKLHRQRRLARPFRRWF